MDDLTVIVLTHNTAEMTRECVSSLLKNGAAPVIVIDNGSTDGTANVLKERFPAVKIMRNDSNLGFARAANAGIAAAETEFVCILNSDAVATTEELSKLADYLKANPSAGMVGPLLVSEEGAVENSFDAEPDLGNQIFPKSLSKALSPARYPDKSKLPAEPFEVEGLVGACMVFRKETVSSEGAFDERYFFFVEETDLCKRLRSKGLKIVVHPGARVVHKKGKSKAQYPVRGRLQYWISIVKFFRKWRPAQVGFLWLGLLLKFSIQFTLNLVAGAFTLFLLPNIRSRFVAAAASLAWLLLFCPESFGIEGLTVDE